MFARSRSSCGRIAGIVAILTISGSGCAAAGGLLAGGGAAGGPLGIIQTVVGIIASLPNPLQAEYPAGNSATSALKLVIAAPLTSQPTGVKLADLETPPVAAVINPADGYIYFTEKISGRVRKFDPNTGLVDPRVILDLPVNSSGTRGLNGIAFSPDGGTLFLTYSHSSTGDDSGKEPEADQERLSSFPFPAATPETILFSATPRDPLIPLPSDLDGLGTCLIGPDGKLYFSHGDWNTRLGAQDISGANPAGKIMRVNLDGSVPSDNPLPNSPFFCWGLRDPFSFTFDSQNGTMWIADLGGQFDDELNIGLSGANFGFPLVHGTSDSDWERLFTLNPFFLRDPAVDFAANFPQPGFRSVIVVRGGVYGSELEGSVVYAHSTLFGDPPHSKVTRIFYDINNPVVTWSDVWEAPPEAGRVEWLITQADGKILAFCQNQIYRLEPPAP